MFQYLMGRVLQAHAPDVILAGCKLPEWGVDHPEISDKLDRERVIVADHVFPFRQLTERLRSGAGIDVCVSNLSTRMEYYANHLALAREIFPIDPNLRIGYGPEHIVFNLRIGDIYGGLHPNYTVLPIRFYIFLSRKTGLKPVFIGELDDNDYTRALRIAFPEAPFVHNENPLDDFNMVRTSAVVVPSVSTFCWLAAWLSSTARQIHFPIIGMYNPNDRPDIDLLPVQDQRYTFYSFPRERWEGRQDQIYRKIAGEGFFEPIQAPRLYKCRATIRAWREGRLPSGLSVWRGLRSSL